MSLHTVWTGDIQFGLATVPVKLHLATDEANVVLHKYQAGTTERVRHMQVNEVTGLEVSSHDIVKGYDEDGGQAVTFEPGELEALKAEKSRSIAVDSFVSLSEVDPIHFISTYYLAPAGKAVAKRGAVKDKFEAYALLAAVLEDTQRAAVVTFVMRSKEHLGVIRASNGRLTLNTMHWPEAIRDVTQVEVPEGAERDGALYTSAVALVGALTKKWEPAEHKNAEAARVMNLVADKRALIAEDAVPVDQAAEFNALWAELGLPVSA